MRAAHEMLTTMGVMAFAARAAGELRAAGEVVRAPDVDPRQTLTGREAHIVQLAHDGLSNAEIGSRLFISPRTVEYHLHKVFAKLGVSSRKELGQVP